MTLLRIANGMPNGKLKQLQAGMLHSHLEAAYASLWGSLHKIPGHQRNWLRHTAGKRICPPVVISLHALPAPNLESPMLQKGYCNFSQLAEAQCGKTAAIAFESIGMQLHISRGWKIGPRFKSKAES